MQSNLKLGSMAPFTGKPSLSQSVEPSWRTKSNISLFCPHFSLQTTLNLSLFCVQIVLCGTSFVVLSCLLLLSFIYGP